MFAMCFIYYKIYEIARTQYLMPTGLALKTKSLPSRTAGDEPLQQERQERQSMNSENRYDYESCKASGAGKNIKENGVSNLGLEIENTDKGNRTKTFIEVIEDTDNGINQIDQNDKGIEQDIKDEGKNESDMVEDVSQARLEDVNLQVEEQEQEQEGGQEEQEEEEQQGEESGKISEDTTQKKPQSTDQTNLDHPEALVNENINKVEEKDNSSLCDVDVDHRQDHALPRQAVTSQQDANEEDNTEENEEDLPQHMTNETTPKNETLGSEGHKEVVKSCSVSEEEDQDEASSSGEQQEGGGSTNEPANHAVVSLEMKTYLRNKVLTNEDREKSSSRDSLQSTCTLQSTLPDARSSVLARGREHIHELSSSRDTLNSAFGSLEDLTKRKKIFVKNRKAARTISIIVSAFLICWMPYNTFSIVMNICQKKCYTPSTFQVSQILLYVGYLNSILNPIIFSYQNVQFRIAYRKILRKVFPCLKLSVN